MDHQIQYPGNMAEGTLMPQNDAVKLTPELIDSFEAYMKNKGMDQGSIKSYRQAVEMLYQWLPEEKVMDRDTLRQWSENLQKESYAVRTVNRFLSVGNTLADFLGHREFQIKTLMVDADEVLPELTRNEYLRMLQTAKALKNERVYFLIKVFANVDLPVQQASKLTVEAAEEGKLVINRGGGREIITSSPKVPVSGALVLCKAERDHNRPPVPDQTEKTDAEDTDLRQYPKNVSGG